MKKVVLPQQAPWLSDLEAELFAFPSGSHDDIIVVCFSGRGDKDCFEVARLQGEEIEVPFHV